MLFRKFILFGILLFNYLTCCCQFGIIKGVVKSNKGDILQGAAVIYRSDITIGCITNEFGAYELKLPTGNRKFTCRYTGMISDTFSVNVKSNEITTFNITLKEGVEEIRKPFEGMSDMSVKDKSLLFNTDLVESLEFDNLIRQAMTTMDSAYHRKESRGAHAREDFNKRDDKNYMKHTLAWQSGNEVKVKYRDVHARTLTNDVQYFPPKERVY